MFLIMNLILAVNLSTDVPINKINISQDNLISIDIIQEKSSSDRREEIKNLYDHIPMNPDHVCYTVQLCSEYSIDPDIIFALIEVESRYNPKAKNKHSSATGYGQLIASTANNIAKELNSINSYNHKIDAYDPYINLLLTVHYFSKCINKSNNDIYKALKFYRGKNDVCYFNKVLSIRKRIKESKKL